MLNEAVEIAKDAASVAERAEAFAKRHPNTAKYLGISYLAERIAKDAKDLAERVFDFANALEEAAREAGGDG